MPAFTTRRVPRSGRHTRRVEVGRLKDVLSTKLKLDVNSLSFARDALANQTRVLAQWSAHGRPMEATLSFDTTWSLELDAPARPVAPGQTVVFYREDEPSIVEGAAIVTS